MNIEHQILLQAFDLLRINDNSKPQELIRIEVSKLLRQVAEEKVDEDDSGEWVEYILPNKDKRTLRFYLRCRYNGYIDSILYDSNTVTIGTVDFLCAINEYIHNENAYLNGVALGQDSWYGEFLETFKQLAKDNKEILIKLHNLGASMEELKEATKKIAKIGE